MRKVIFLIFFLVFLMNAFAEETELTKQLEKQINALIEKANELKKSVGQYPEYEKAALDKIYIVESFYNSAKLELSKNKADIAKLYIEAANLKLASIEAYLEKKEKIAKWYELATQEKHSEAISKKKEDILAHREKAKDFINLAHIFEYFSEDAQNLAEAAMNTRGKIKKLKEQANALEQSANASEDLFNALKESTSLKKAKLEEQKDEMGDQYKNKLKELDDKLKSAEEDAKKKREEANKMRKELNEKISEAAKIQTELAKKLREETNEAQKNYEVLQAELDALSKEIEALKKVEAAQAAGKTDVEELLKKAEELLEKVEQKKQLEEEVEKAKEKLEKMQNLTNEATKEANNLNKEVGPSALEKFFKFVEGMIRAYPEYVGFAKLAALFGGKEMQERIAKNRERWRQRFCDTILLGGIECWSMKICEKKVKRSPQPGSLVVLGPGGRPRAVAHIEGERTKPTRLTGADKELLEELFGRNATVYIEGKQFSLDKKEDVEALRAMDLTIYLYRVTYYLTNPLTKEMNFNVYFYGPRGRIAWYKDPRKTKIAPGGSSARMGTYAIVKYSPHYYEKVCLEWSPEIEAFGGKKKREICNYFSVYEGPPTPYSQRAAQEQAAQATGGLLVDGGDI